MLDYFFFKRSRWIFLLGIVLIYGDKNGKRRYLLMYIHFNFIIFSILLLYKMYHIKNVSNIATIEIIVFFQY